MKRIVAAAVIAACGSTLLLGADRWLYLGNAASGEVEISIDTTTITRDGGMATVWVKYHYTGQYGKLLGGNYVFENLQREEYNCKLMRYSTLSYASFGKQGEPVASGTYLTPPDVPIVPDTATEAVWRAVCT